MEKHIRDVLEGNIQNVSMHAMCGDNGSRLTFAIPIGATCRRCKERWEEEKRKDVVRHKFRLKMHGVLNGGHSVE